MSLSRGRREPASCAGAAEARRRRLPVRPEAHPVRLPGRKRRPEPAPRPVRRGRARGSVVVMTRLERDRRRAAKGLEVGDHAEDFLIGEADRRLVDDGHPRIESRHDEFLGFVYRLGEVLDIAQAGDAGLRADIDPREVGEPERPLRLTDRVAGQAQSLAVHDLAAHLDHVGRGQVGSDHSLLRRQHFLLRHHLADIRIERRRREDESADPDRVRDRHAALARSSVSLKSGLSCRLVIQNTKPIRRKNRRTVTETTRVAKPMVGVNASTEVSRTTP